MLYKKDGYRQQNVHQRQKLISIIDYDVCMTFYYNYSSIASYLTLNNIVTLKTGIEVSQGH